MANPSIRHYTIDKERLQQIKTGYLLF